MSLNDWQLRWAGSLAALVQAAATAKEAAAAADQQATAAAAAAAARLAAITGRSLPASGPPGRLHVEAATPPGSPLPPAHAAAAAQGDTLASPAAPPPPAAARPQTKALGVFGRVWDFLIDEAAYVESAEGAHAWYEEACGGSGRHCLLRLQVPPWGPLPNCAADATPAACSARLWLLG